MHRRAARGSLASMTLDERLSILKAEHAKGRAVLADLQSQRRQIDAQEQSVTLTLARIEGAMTICQELIDPKDPNGEAPAPVGGPPAPATP